jgi:hypothetical protein
MRRPTRSNSLVAWRASSEAIALEAADWGEVQRPRGLGHMHPLGDGDEDAKLLQSHGDRVPGFVYQSSI